MKVGKKFRPQIAIILSFVLLLQLLGPITSAINGQSVLLAHVDFNSYANDARPLADFNEAFESGTSRLRVKNFPGNGNKSLHITDSSNADYARLRKDFPAQTGIMTAEWMVYNVIENATSPYMWINLQERDGVNAVSIGIRSNEGGQVAYRNSANTIVNVEGVQVPPLTWNKITVVADVGTNRYDLYVNGTKVLERSVFNMPASSIGRFYMLTGLSVSGINAYLDNVMIASGDQSPQPSILANVSLTAGQTALKRGETTQLHWSFLDQNGSVISPATVTTNVYSSRPEVAVINESGLVTAVTPGDTLITVEAMKEGIVASASLQITVSSDSKAELVAILVGGTPISGFNSSQLQYSVQLPPGTSSIPVVTAVSAQYSTVIVTQANQVPGQATVHVTSEDGQSNRLYVINFTESYYYHNDFLSYGDNVAPTNEFDITEFGTARVRVRNFPSADNKSLHILDNKTTDTTARWSKYIPPQSGTVTMEWKFYNAYTGNANETLWTSFSGHDRDGALKNAMRVGVKYSTGKLIYNHSTGGEIEIADIKPLTWYKVTLIGDVLSNTYSIYVNGHPVVEGVRFVNEVQDVRRLYVESGYSPQNTSMYVNYITMSSGVIEPIPAVFAQADVQVDQSKLQRASTAKVAINLYNQDETGFVGPYTVRYTSSNEAVATVDVNGVVTAVSPGAAEITAEITAQGRNVIKTVNLTVVPYSSAALSEMRAAGVLLADFQAEQTTYTIALPKGSAIPDVTASPSELATVSIRAADKVPGQTIITVVSEDQKTVNTYTINFVYEGVSSNTNLKEIKVNGERLHDFRSERNAYTVFYDAHTFPILTAEAEDSNAIVAVTEQVDQLGVSKRMTITVTAEDSLNRKQYTVTIARENTFFVSPEGNDGWSGFPASPVGDDGPFLTLAKARDAVRQHKQSGMNGDITVYVRGGQYPITAPVSFSQQDSGTDGFRILYKAYPGETPVLNGAVKLIDWSLHEGSIYRTYVGSDYQINTLSVNDERAVIARHPNNEYLGVAANVPGSLRQQFKFKAGEIPNVANVQGMQVLMWNGPHQNWYRYTREIGSIDYTTNTVTLAADMAVNMQATIRYFVQNAYEFLDMPGEFYHNRADGYLYYWPKGDIQTEQIYAARSAGILRFEGSTAEDSGVVRNITVEGLHLVNGNSGNMIVLNNADSVEIKHSRIINGAGSGVKMQGRAIGNLLYGNEIAGIGHNGVDIEGIGANTLIAQQNRTHSNTIESNYIHHTGVTSGYGAGVYLYSTGNNRVVHNRIYYTPRYSISMKFPRYGELYSQGKRVNGQPVSLDPESEYYVSNFIQTKNNYIAFNDVSYGNYDSSDTGLIESYGTRENTIHNNIVHDSYINDSFGFAIYLDDASDDFTITNNVVYNTNMAGMGDGSMYAPLVLKGKNNKAENNIFADNDAFRGHVFFQQNTDHESNKDIELARNIFYNNGESLYHFVNWTDSNPLRYAEPGDRLKSSDYNLFFNPDGKYSFYTVPNVYGFEGWQSVLDGRYDQHSMIADPLFMDRENRDYRLSYQSPAYRLGFEDIDFASVGLKNDYRYADRQEEIDKVYILTSRFGNNPVVHAALQEAIPLEVLVRTKSGFIADVTDAVISYTSLNPAVASVDVNGVLKGNSTGITVIRVTVQKSGVTKHTFFYASVNRGFEKLTLTAPVSQLAVGKTADMHYFGSTADGAPIPLKSAQVIWSSSDGSVASVDTAGRVTAIGAGTVTITASVSAEGTTRTAFVQLDVFVNPLSKVTLNTKLMMNVGDQHQSNVTGKLTDGSTANLSGAELHYVSSNPAAIQIHSDGFVTAVAPGTAELTVHAKMNGVTKVNRVKVVVIDPDPDLNGYRLINFGGAQSTASYDPDQDEYTIVSLANGSGTVRPTQDHFASVAKEVKLPEGVTSFTVQAHISSIEHLNNTQITAGIFLKDNVNPGSNMINFRIQLDGGTRMNYRTAENTVPGQSNTHWIQYPIDLKLEKNGNVFTASYRMEGGKWHHFRTMEFPIGDQFIVGVFVLNPMNPKLPTEYKIKNLVITPNLPDRDAVAPVTKAEIAGMQSDNGWYVSDLQVTFAAADNRTGSGVAKTEYRSNGGEWVTYTNPITWNQDGEYTLEYRSTDRAGNVEPEKKIGFKVDRTAPVADLYVNGNRLLASYSMLENETAVFTLKANDEHSGLQESSITVNGKPYAEGTELRFHGLPGEHTIQVVVKDRAGNVLQGTYRFKVKATMETLRYLLNHYMDQGEVQGPLAKQLENRLEQAQRHLAANREDQAAKHLDDFLKSLHNEPMQRHVTEHARAAMTASATYVMKAIGR